MNKRALLFALLFLFSASQASAALIDTSLNPAVSPGLVPYLDSASGWPTPQQDPTKYPSLPVVQTNISPNDPIRVAESIDLLALDPATDDNGSAAWDLNALLWVVDWYAPGNATPVGSNVIKYEWSKINQDIAAGKTQVTFWTDLYIPSNFGPLASGDWAAASYFETDTQYRAFAQFHVPAPGALLLMSVGLAGALVLRRRA